MEETGLGSEDEDEDLKVKEFEQDYNTLSTPRLRLLEAQLFDEQTHLESRREEEDETDLLENILEQNREEIDVEDANQSFLRELDSAIDNIQKWKYRPPEEDNEMESLNGESEAKLETIVEMEQLHGRYADEKKIHSLEELLHSPRYVDEDNLEERRTMSENLVRLRRLEEEVRSNELLGSQLAESKVREEGLELENNLGDLEQRLRMYNDELDLFLRGGGGGGDGSPK